MKRTAQEAMQFVEGLAEARRRARQLQDEAMVKFAMESCRGDPSNATERGADRELVC